MRCYIRNTAHFISNEKIRNALLACRQSKGHYTAENIVTQFEKIASDFKITVQTNEFSALLDVCSSLIDVV